MPAPQPAPTPATGFDAEHAHALLRGLMEAGAAIVGTLVQQAKADPVPHPFWGDKVPVDHPTEHIARCYDCITRSVRRTIALAKHLDDPVRPRPPVEPPAPKRAPQPAPKPANDSRPERPESIDRPDAPDWHEDFTADLARPLDDVLDEIEADLTLTPAPIIKPKRNQPLYVWTTRSTGEEPPPPEPPPPSPQRKGRGRSQPQAHPTPSPPGLGPRSGPRPG